MRKIHISKHRYDDELPAEDDERNTISSKSDNHHHKRKHKKHKHKSEDMDHDDFKNGSDESPLRNSADVIEVHGSSSEDECQNGTDNHDYNRMESHRHHRKEERRHKKKRRRSCSNSNSCSRDKDVEYTKSRHKRSKGNDERTARTTSESESDHYSSNDHGRVKSKEQNSVDKDGEHKRTEFKRRGDGEDKGRIRPDRQIKIERESNERQGNRQIKTENDKRNNEEPSGSRGNARRHGSRDRNVHEWGNSGGDKHKSKKQTGEVQKPNFGLSGKLTEDTNMFNGVVIKYSEPPEARMPKKRWRLYPFKGDQPLPPLYIHRQSAYLLGRDRKVVDMPIDHPSCSKQHAALQYRLISYERADGSVGKQIRLYIIDLESANGTFINNKKIEPRKYVELFEKDVIKFGFSSREYVLLHEHSKDDNPIQDDT